MARANRYYILGCVAIGREVMEADRVYELGERDVSYNHNFAGENSGLRPENSYFWNLSILISTTLLGPTPRRTAQTRRELPPILPASHSLAPGPRQRGSQK
jgi:hypothetical protein